MIFSPCSLLKWLRDSRCRFVRSFVRLERSRLALRSRCITSSSIHSYNSFIHSFFQQGTMHTCHLRHTRTRYCTIVPPPPSISPFLWRAYTYTRSIVIENLFKRARARARTHIYCKHTHTHTYTHQYCHIYLCAHNFLPPFSPSLKHLSRFIRRVT